MLILKSSFAFFFVGVYRESGVFTSIGDFIIYGKGVVIGSILSIVAFLLLYRFQNFRARSLFSTVCCFWSLVGSRMAFRLIREIPFPFHISPKAVGANICRAGDGGEMLLRELRKNAEWNFRPVGFVDDDPLKQDKLINGLKVFDANGTLPDICREYKIQAILISSAKISPDALKTRPRTLSRNRDPTAQEANQDRTDRI